MTGHRREVRRLRRVAVAAALLGAVLGAPGCVTPLAPMRPLRGAPDGVAPCRIATDANGAPLAIAVAWHAPERSRDRDTLDRWCVATGPPVAIAAPAASSAATAAGGTAVDASALDELAIVSWNLDVGAADLDRLFAGLRSGAYTAGRPVSRFVLLAQEAYRAGAAVPRAEARSRAARAIRRAGTRQDVVAAARRASLAVYYAPSMRNGRDADEDRGNAILSTEPLADLQAIELPFERQRRVAIAATVAVRLHDGREVRLPLASVHLEVVAPPRQLWLFGGGRRRQVRGLLSVLPADGPLVVGGDFNTWRGFSDGAYRAVAAALADLTRRDRRPTFRGWLRLDHVFARLGGGWRADGRRLDDRLGSDHHPLLVRLRPPPR